MHYLLLAVAVRTLLVAACRVLLVAAILWAFVVTLLVVAAGRKLYLRGGVR